MPSVRLKPGRERSLLRHHPWVFSGAIAKVSGSPMPGETVEVQAADGTLLGRGAYSPASQIVVRMWSFDPAEAVTPALFAAKLARSAALRELLHVDGGQAACRLVNAESDGLPGVVVDRYGEFLVCQFLTAGAEHLREALLHEIMARWPAAGVYERSDVEVRRKEGLALRAGLLAGREPPALLEIGEGPCRFLVDVRAGHKTGFYLDQRDNRLALAAWPALGGREALNAFSYTGGFALALLRAGASRVTNVESSADALALATRHVELNGLEASRVEQVVGDVFTVLRDYRSAGRLFDIVLLDPPKFVESREKLARGARGYKDINLLACRLLRPGGLLVTFSCSGLLDAPLFQKIVADAALDAGREASIIRRLSQAADHPTALSFPEGTYLKGLVCVVK